MLKSALASFAIIAVVGAMTPAAAHHSGAMFDNQKEVVLNGMVTQFQYTNPHSWIQLKVPAANGSAVEWSIETAAPIVLLRAGIKANALRTGDKITLRAHPMKNGTAAGSLIDVKMEDGTVLSLKGSGNGY
jgi:hypothetical protein